MQMICCFWPNPYSQPAFQSYDTYTVFFWPQNTCNALQQAGEERVREIQLFVIRAPVATSPLTPTLDWFPSSPLPSQVGVIISCFTDDDTELQRMQITCSRWWEKNDLKPGNKRKEEYLHVLAFRYHRKHWPTGPPGADWILYRKGPLIS